MTIEEAKALGYEVVKASPFEVGLVKNGKGIRTWFCQDFDRRLPDLDHPKIQEAIQRTEQYAEYERCKDEQRAAMRQTPAGRLLVRYGFEPYDTESAARTVAEKAAADIAELEKLVRDYVRASEEDNDLGEAMAFGDMKAWVLKHPNT
jgi:hypothetical protein